MLFFIDDSIAIAKSVSSDERTSFCCSLDYIADACRHGKHRLFIKNSTLTHIIDEYGNDISSVSLRFYNHYRSKITFQLSYFRRLKWHVRLVLRGSIAVEELSDGRKSIIVPARHFEGSEIGSSSIMLCENSDDCNFYQEICQIVTSRDSTIGNIILRFESRGGGGSTINTEYENIQNRENRLCLSIADSDRQYPTGPLGGTATGLVQVDKVDKPLSVVEIIGVKNIEGLIPLGVIKKLANSVENKQSYAFMRDIENNEKGCLAYYDFKKGLIAKDFIDTPGSPKYVFWTNALDQSGKVTHCTHTTPCTRKEDCQCRFAPGWSRILIQANTWFRDNKVKAIEEFDEYHEVPHTKVEWLRLSEIIMSWGCGGEFISGL